MTSNYCILDKAGLANVSQWLSVSQISKIAPHLLALRPHEDLKMLRLEAGIFAWASDVKRDSSFRSTEQSLS